MSLEAKVGALQKKESTWKGATWKRRSLLLDGTAIYSFRKAPDLTPLGRILISDAQIQVNHERACLASAPHVPSPQLSA